MSIIFSAIFFISIYLSIVFLGFKKFFKFNKGFLIFSILYLVFFIVAVGQEKDYYNTFENNPYVQVSINTSEGIKKYKVKRHNINKYGNTIDIKTNNGIVTVPFTSVLIEPAN